MAKTVETKLVWNTVDVSKNAALAPLYADVLKAREAEKAARAKLEPKLKEVLAAKGLAVETDESEVVIGYNFGQLSYAQAPKNRGANRKASTTL